MVDLMDLLGFLFWLILLVKVFNLNRLRSRVKAFILLLFLFARQLLLEPSLRGLFGLSPVLGYFFLLGLLHLDLVEPHVLGLILLGLPLR